ncbi:hypothetical protein IEQ34_022208 [Dendrobium chrysotoxum]|uniref:Uncharacterized protein n=1 Tax=Dendrobium chrysotoxum TaxID=161865 RepID=A0AAV7FY74_DENCH|nr:hypothetical protein IEQ34_022208 [Dendrobium chrysotoxum]
MKADATKSIHKSSLHPYQTSLQEVSGEKESKCQQQAPIYQQGFLASSERVRPKPKILVLLKSCNLHALALEERLRRSASRAPPVLRKLLESKTRRDWVRRIANSLVVAVTARPALVDPCIHHG